MCEALGTGAQSLILRKGGIAEGREGFRFKHDDFLLLPTLFHEQLSKLKLPEGTPLPALVEGQHSVSFRVRVQWTRDLTDWEQVRRLNALHIWTEQTIQERFVYDGKDALSLAFLRVYKLTRPFVFVDSAKYGGCRSWVDLPDVPEEMGYEPVLSDAEHTDREARLLAALG